MSSEPPPWRVPALLDRRPGRVSPAQPSQAVSLLLEGWFPGRHVWGGVSSAVLPAAARFPARVWLPGPRKAKARGTRDGERDGCPVSEAAAGKAAAWARGFLCGPFSARAFLRGRGPRGALPKIGTHSGARGQNCWRQGDCAGSGMACLCLFAWRLCVKVLKVKVWLEGPMEGEVSLGSLCPSRVSWAL